MILCQPINTGNDDRNTAWLNIHNPHNMSDYSDKLDNMSDNCYSIHKVQHMNSNRKLKRELEDIS